MAEAPIGRGEPTANLRAAIRSCRITGRKGPYLFGSKQVGGEPREESAARETAANMQPRRKRAHTANGSRAVRRRYAQDTLPELLSARTTERA